MGRRIDLVDGRLAIPPGPLGPVAEPAVLSAAFRAAADAMLVIAPQGDRVLAANGAAVDLLGEPEEDLCRRAATALYPGQMPALIVFTEAVLVKGLARTRALVPRQGQGRDLRVECVGSRITAADAADPVILVTLYDLDARERTAAQADADAYLRGGIAEWRLAQRFFQDMERENQLLLRAAGEGIYGVNADGTTTFVNPAAERMLGWAAEDLVGKGMHDVIHYRHLDGRHYPHADCPIYAAFKDGAVHRVEDEVFWRKDGRPIRVEYTSTPLRDHGRLIGAVIVFRDVTQRKEAEERLRSALQEVDHLRQRLEMENAYLQEEIRTENNHHEIIGQSAAILTLLDQIAVVGPTEAGVLITGESGTGKELVARALHEASPRRQRPLIRVNCAAIPRELFESEFFGHVRGAFTGATRDRAGRFELANGGTLFLDEVGEIPLELQGKLLRVLQEKVLERVGQETTRQVDVRIIAATNRRLREEVEAGRFREDLYFRLNVFPIESVPLRRRREDIPLLAAHFLKRVCRKLNIARAPTLTQGNVQQLCRYDWPGNVRELENVIERAAILARHGKLCIDLPATAGPSLAAASPPAFSAAGPGPVSGERRMLTAAEMKALERDNIALALETTGGKVSGPGGAAALLGMKPTTLASRIKALGVGEMGG